MNNILGNFRKSLKLTLLRIFAAVLLLGVLIAQAPIPNARAAGEQLILTKSIEGGATTARVGDVIRYRIRFECSSLTGPCGQMEITDVLQAGLIYLPPPSSSVPSGFSIAYDSPTRKITITKDDNNLLDGSQYDAVIAVQVDYDLRTLPAIINNTLSGRIDPPGPTSWINATPALAPPITIGTANPYWGLTKALSSPSINPTVNTDVTYQVALCPTTPPSGQGNVPLRNITLTDTLPVGATFVSASNGGLFSSGTVTWPVVAGPIYPPSCLTRFVTIRYNTPTFSVGGPNVINTANASADYTPSSGTCTSPCIGVTGNITHPIATISEVPSYTKDDIGDPVGFTGTGRFILNLNTNNTNYPSNNLILIDNMPPQFQITGVTTGQWSAAFDYISAFVEYSTNNGSTYTPFPGQPISYNTNATYAAPADNLTNVRWRFQYDPDKTAPFNYTQAGLPYTWAFTTSPEIRVKPRTVATTASAPSGAAMPAAVAGLTYDNCLQVSRTNSSGTPLTEACNIEQMTVQGSFVSLRTSKSETPGASWDDLSDPLISTFTADGSILPGDTLRYTITVEVTERSSVDLVNPTIRDTLPAAADFVFVRNGTARLDGVPLAAQPTFTQVGQVLTWAWNNPSPALSVTPLALGSRFLTVEFFAYVPRGQAPGSYINNLYVVTDSTDALCENGTQEQDSANGDVDGDSDATDPACKTSDPYVVERSAALRGEKWIRSTDPINSQVVDASTFLPAVLPVVCPNGGTTGLTGGGSNPFTRFPCIAQAYPEGAFSPGQIVPPPPAINPALDDFEYNLRIFNDGNVPMLSYVLYDILPYVGDKGSGGTLSSTARDSEFRPVMRGPIEFLSGPGLTSASFTIEYNNTSNPCRPEVFNQPTGDTVPGSCNNLWTTTWSVSALSYRIRLNAGSFIQPAATSSEVRFGVPMYIPFDALPAGFDPNDALSHEIAWNSFSHVGSYDKNPSSPPVQVQDLLASEPRKVGITVPERMSVGNRVWRDADNSGTINPPDDSTPGIAGVTVNLYRDVDNNGVADGPAITTTTTDTGGYYLFSNIPYDSLVMNNNRYIIGIPATNFASDPDAGGPLLPGPLNTLRSSTGTPAIVTYTNPPANVIDSADDGIDPTPGLEVFSTKFILQPTTEPATESDLSANLRDGLAGQRRGVNGERNNNSDLTLDFGFFGGTDVPFSLGNHVWKDNGQTGAGPVFNYALRNDGIRQATEPPVVGALVRLYRDGNANGTPEPAEMIRTDLTDDDGFYLFDNLDPGPYYIEIAPSNFQTGGPLIGWYSSQVTGTENVGVPGNTNTPNMDSDDNGIDRNFPENTGIFSGVIVLTRGVNEQTGETHLSSDTGSLPGFNPTFDDGPNSRGRFGESDDTSNLTIDFGFIPPMSLGNRVWIDEGAGTTTLTAPFPGFNNGVQDSTEAGVSGVTVQLWRDTNGTAGLQIATDTLMDTDITDATGYYLFERMQPASDYFVHIPAANFAAGQPLRRYVSSTDAVAPADNFIDKNDNGIDQVTPSTTGITSQQITMQYNSEPLTPANEIDIPANTPANVLLYGPNLRGLYGQADEDSNLTLDFGFVRPPRSIGNRLWYDLNNNLQVDAGEGPVPTGVRVSLYLDTNTDGQPDDLGTVGDRTDDWIAYDLTDADGYYLFDGLPANNYIVGVDRIAFASGGLLYGYNSSKGSVDNLPNNTDNLDNGVDRLLRADPVASPHGILSTRINLTATPVNAPTGEVGSGDTSLTLGFNPTAGDGANSRGRFGETDTNGDLTLDFGFFIPMSLGNRVFLDDGAGGGTYNNGIMEAGELPIANVRVELYRDADANGAPDAGGLVDFDVTDAGGYYLFDDLAQGSYVVLIPSGNFTASFDPDGSGPLPTAAGALLGRNTSFPTGTETTGVAGNPYTPNTDRDDNGVNLNSGTPATTGILSGTIVLAHTTEPAGVNSETELSGQADPGSPANLAFGPTGWDGPTPGSRGRWDEIDSNSNLTIDFGFIPVYSLGNRVWLDTDNSSARNGAEVGLNGVRVQLFASDGTTEILVGPDGILNTADDATGGMLTAGATPGYYLFNNLPAGDYIVRIPASNFGAGQPLQGKWSSATTISNAGLIGETAAPDADTTATDSDDNGTLTSGNVDSLPVTLGPISTPEPTGESDLNAGNQGQPDAQANMTVDFGFYTMTLGNVVWGDVNNDGLLAGGETGINGVTVQLWSQDLSAQLATTTTAGGGVYTFTGLAAGNYIVRIPAFDFNSVGVLENYRSSTGAVPPSTYEPAPNPDITTVDSDDNGTETGGKLGAGGYVQTSVFALTPAAEQSVTDGSGLTTENRVDFGLTELVALGNRVWKDTGADAHYNNGILDADESGVNGVTVELYTSTGTKVQVGPDGILGTADDASGDLETSGGGYYAFDQLFPGTYYVFIPADQFDDAGDTLFGYVSTLGNGLINDNDDQSGLTGDENGIDGTNANPLTSVGIRTPNYALLSNTLPTGEDQSNYAPGILDDDNVNFTADFGFVQLVDIGNLVWVDDGAGGGTPDNGIQDGTEAGVPGVEVRLYASGAVIGTNAPIDTTTTDANGRYEFDKLNPGQYFVHLPASMFDATAPSPLAGYFSSTSAGSNPLGDEDTDENGLDAADLETNGISSRVYTLTPNDLALMPTADDQVNYTGYLDNDNVNFTADFGFLSKVALGNRVWKDNGAGGGVANDGIQQSGESGVNGVRVELYKSDDTFVGFTTTATLNGQPGSYQFDNLLAESYYIKIPASEFASGKPLFEYGSSFGHGTEQTLDEDEDENGIDSATPETTGITSPVYALTGSMRTGEDQTSYTGVLSDNAVNFTADFGFVQRYGLGNRVWFDTNNNGLIDASEVGADGVEVRLYAANSSGNPTGLPLASDITEHGGYYLFDNLYPGDYVVVLPADNFAASAVLEGYWSSLTFRDPATGLVDETAAPDPDSNGADTTANTADDDLDSDDNGALTTLTGFSGAVISLPISLGPDGATEPDDEATVDKETGIGDGAQPDGRSNLKVDFGFYKLSLGNLVWADANKNGAYDSGESLLDISLSLYAADASGNPIGAAIATVTSVSGVYRFDGLPAGDYIVSAETPTGSNSTVDIAASSDTTDPNTNTDDNDNGVGTSDGTVYSEPVTLSAGLAATNNIVDNGTGILVDDNGTLVDLGATHNPTLDFGFTPIYALGNRVWFDTNNNRIMDKSESGADGVTVQLFAASDLLTPLQTQTTVNGGYYLFNGLEAGDYLVVIPGSNFSSGVLKGYWSSGISYDSNTAFSEIAPTDPDDDADLDDNGLRQTDTSVASGIVTLGPTFLEPVNDDDLDGGQQGQPDNQANMSVDFGFYTITLGDLVWNDFDDSGLVNSESGIDGVTLELYRADSSGAPVGSAIDTTTTAGGGLYAFEGLAEGSYLVRLPQANFLGTGALRDYYSSVGGGTYEPDAPAPDANTTDSDDNGQEVGTLGYTGGYVQSDAFALTPTGEDTYNNPTGLTAEPRVDFGFNNNPQVNLSILKTETPAKDYYLAGEITTYEIVVTNHGPADVIGAVVSDDIPTDGATPTPNPLIATWTWTCVAAGGATGCDPYTGSGDFTDTVDMPIDSTITYTVTATVSATATGDLVNLASVSHPDDTNPDDNEAEETNEPASLTVTKDDGVTIVAPGAVLTYTLVIENTGAVNLTSLVVTDTLPADVTFQSASFAPDPTSVPALGTSGGTLIWTAPFSLNVGESQTITVIVRVNDAPAGTSLNNIVEVEDTKTKTTDTDDDLDNLAISNEKALTFASQHGAIALPPLDPLPQVYIGETLTYRIQVTLPPGTVTNLTARDLLDPGLAFDECTSATTTPVGTGVTIPTDLVVTLPTGVTSACPAISGDPRVTNAGHQVEFTFGTVENNTGEDRTIVVEYLVVVLDIPENVSGPAGLKNAVTWSWDGISKLPASAVPVDLTEPDLSILKTASPTTAVYGTPIDFTLDVAHTTASTAHAYDVVLSDTLPLGLTFVAGSIVPTGLAPTSYAYDPATRTLQFVWDEFPLAATATIRFQAVFVGPSPVVNEARVEWSSLPIDPALPGGPPTQQSEYNPFSTERWYDPADLAPNNYGEASSVTIQTPGRKRGSGTAQGLLPATGFAPDQVTNLPEQPALKAYTSLEETWLEVPNLGLSLPITGVPIVNGEWDLTWLSNQAGYLEGTTYPGRVGTSGLTGHVTLADGTPGPFRNLDRLIWGNQLILHANGQRYIYEVRELRKVIPSDFSIFKNDGYTWLTLITCKDYAPLAKTYSYRTAVRAVLIRVEPEASALPASGIGTDR